MKVLRVALLLLGAAVALAGCTGRQSQRPSAPESVLKDPAQPGPAAEPAPVKPKAEPQRPAWVTPVIDENFPALVHKHRPNELGEVLILEYHHLGDEEERWTRQWDNFRRDLETLYAKGYRAVNLLEYLNDAMKLPAGASPVIFTFDDGVLTQFKWADGKPDPQSAVGIMLAFKQKHPDFGAAGTFYVNFTPVPFREEESWKEKIRFLAANGFEVANHTVYHEDLSTLSGAGVQEALGAQVRRLREILPDYDGSTLALPFGAWPQSERLAISGEWEGVAYSHRAVLLVGADPAYSRYDRRLDVMALPRVQAIASEFERWFPHLDRARYISDGDPDTVVFPAAIQDRLLEGAVKGKRVRTYSAAQ